MKLLLLVAFFASQNQFVSFTFAGNLCSLRVGFVCFVAAVHFDEKISNAGDKR